VFSNAIVAGAPAYFSFPSLMASRYPLRLGRDVVGLAPGEPTIASALSEVAYCTAAFWAGDPYLSPRSDTTPVSNFSKIFWMPKPIPGERRWSLWVKMRLIRRERDI
jgi:hypothetical protein